MGVSQRARSAARNRDVRATFGARDVAAANLSIAMARTVSRKQMAVQEAAGKRASAVGRAAASKTWNNDEKVW
jgi:hypothetical protein